MEDKRLDEKSTKKGFRGKPQKGVNKFASRKGKSGKMKPGDDVYKEVYKKGPNDPAWRTSDKVMTKLVANLPFGLPAGLSEGYIDVHTGGDGVDYQYVQPGVMAIEMLVTGGTAKDYNSALNLSFRKIYSYVRHANSGSKIYEAADLGIYFIAIGQLLALLGYTQRALRIVNQFSPTNRYTPATLIRAMGLDPDDLLQNQAQLKYIVAWLGRAVGGLAFPDIPYFHACYEAFKYIYVDNDSPKEQFYLFTPKAFGIYNPTYDSNGGGVSYNKASYNAPSTTALSNLSNLIGYIKERVDIVMGDEDCGIISGDILKAFKDGGLFTPEAFPEDYDVLQHSEEVLQQIHNLTTMRADSFNFDGYHQDPGTLNTAPYIVQEYNVQVPVPTGTSDKHWLAKATIIDAFSRIPEPEEVVNCMVLNPQSTCVLASDGTHYLVDDLSFDLFLPTNVYIYDALTDYSPEIVGNRFSKAGGDLMLGTISNDRFDITNFDWHPIIWQISVQGTVGTIRPCGDIQNIRFFDHDVGVRIHENSLLSLFAFNEMNFYNKITKY